MKQQVSPAVAIGVIAALVLVVGGFMFMRAGKVSKTTEKQQAMPAEAAAEFSKRMGGSQVTGSNIPQGNGGGGPGSMAPTTPPGGGSMPGGPGGVPMGPPGGAPR